MIVILHTAASLRIVRSPWKQQFIPIFADQLIWLVAKSEDGRERLLARKLAHESDWLVLAGRVASPALG